MAEVDITELEANLKNFIIDAIGSEDPSLAAKCRGLKLMIDCSDRNRPMFKVQIGCMESLFNISDCIKASGALGGGVDRIIPKWYMRINAKDKFMTLVREYNKENKEIKMEKDKES